MFSCILSLSFCRTLSPIVGQNKVIIKENSAMSVERGSMIPGPCAAKVSRVPFLTALSATAIPSLQYFHLVRSCSLRLFCARGVPGFRDPRLQGMRDLHPGAATRHNSPQASLERRQSPAQFQVRHLQEDLLVSRVPDRISLRMVWDHSKYNAMRNSSRNS